MFGFHIGPHMVRDRDSSYVNTEFGITCIDNVWQPNMTWDIEDWVLHLFCWHDLNEDLQASFTGWHDTVSIINNSIMTLFLEPHRDSTAVMIWLLQQQWSGIVPHQGFPAVTQQSFKEFACLNHSKNTDWRLWGDSLGTSAECSTKGKWRSRIRSRYEPTNCWPISINGIC